MTDPAVQKTRQRFFWSMRLMVVGLTVELVSLLGLEHPLGFMMFATFGVTLILTGVVVFLVSLLSLVRRPEAGSTE